MQIKSLDEYLNQIVEEFERAWDDFGGADCVPLDRFDYLAEFIQSFQSGGRFDQKFKRPFHAIIQNLEDGRTRELN
jgi:hypothetical protein